MTTRSPWQRLSWGNRGRKEERARRDGQRGAGLALEDAIWIGSWNRIKTKPVDDSKITQILFLSPSVFSSSSEFFFFSTYLLFVIVCVSMCAHLQYECGCQRITCRSRFSPTACVLGTDLVSSGLGASTFTCWTISGIP